MAQYNVPSYCRIIGKESGAPEWFSVVRGQVKKRLITEKEMNNTVSKIKDVPLSLQKFCSKFT